LRVRFPSINDTDDLVQEAYARLFRARNQGKISAPKPYLYATARNVALDLFRHEGVVTVERVAEFDRLSILDSRPDAAETACRNEELKLLAEAIRMLPARCHKVLVLRKIFGLSQKASAARLGITENTVAAQVAIGMRRCIAYFRTLESGSRRAAAANPTTS
jgi:RNA polymerase sigma-70 factor (ECF subfamily)